LRSSLRCGVVPPLDTAGAAIKLGFGAGVPIQN